MTPACHCAHLEDAHAGGCMYCPCERFRDASTEWTGELRSLAETGLAMLKKDLERSGHITPFFVLRHQGGGMEQLEIPEEYAELFNSGRAKTRIFGFVRSWVQQHGDINAVITGTDAWFSRSTPQGRHLSQQEFDRIVREEGTEECEKRGLLVRKEAAVVSVQTPERVMSLCQVYERLGRRNIVFREISQTEAPIDNFVGRSKMFGKMDPEDLE